MIEELRRQIGRGEVTCEELVVRSLARISQGNDRVGAVVALRAEQALAEAAALDRQRAAGQSVGPLAGLPVLVKDLEDVAGMVTTQGSLVYAASPPAERDGLVPGRLRAAGGVIVGKSNLPECAFEAYTSNRLYGSTRNPWDLRWSPGGSSGGSAAALSTGMVAIATATDGGGSARIPAAFCGLAGLKPTNGVIGRSPIPSWMDLSTDGLMAHTVGDLRLLLSIAQGPVAGDPSALPFFPPSAARSLRRVFAAPRPCDWGPLDPALQAGFDAALQVLEQDLGLEVELVPPSRVTPAGNADLDWFTICCTEQAHQIGREVLEQRAGDFDPALLIQMQAGLRTPMADYLEARRRRFEHARHLDLLLGEDGVLVTPTVAMTAQHADGRMLGATVAGTPEDAINTALQNLTGHPAVSLPAGQVAGLPFGLQLTGPRYRDGDLLDLAQRWETARPWPWFAPGYDPLVAQP